MKEMVSGQLYLVGLTGRSEGEVTQIELLLVATSTDDAKLRLPYVFDLSDFTTYRVDFVAKEPGRARVLRSKTERVVVQEPDAVIKREEGTQSLWQPVAAPTGRKWEVHAKSSFYARSEAHARRKLAERLMSDSDRVSFVAEEIAIPSGYATARDVSMFERATFVRG